VTSVSTDDEKLAPGRIVAAVIFAVLALAFFVVACVYVITPSYKLPAYLGTAQSSGHHSLRGVASFLIGLAFVGGSWFALRYRSLALEEAREADRTAALSEAEAEQAAVKPAVVEPTAVEPAGSGQATAGQATEA
jgi:hypothetical protein